MSFLFSYVLLMFVTYSVMFESGTFITSASTAAVATIAATAAATTATYYQCYCFNTHTLSDFPKEV